MKISKRVGVVVCVIALACAFVVAGVGVIPETEQEKSEVWHGTAAYYIFKYSQALSCYFSFPRMVG